MGFTKQANYFTDRILRGADHCNGPNGQEYLITTDGERFFLMVRGSRNPFPIVPHEIDPEINGVKLIGTPSVLILNVEDVKYIEIACCLETGGVQYWLSPLEDFPDPSGDEPHPFV